MKINLVNNDLLYTKGDSINVLKKTYNGIIINKPSNIYDYLSYQFLIQKLNDLKEFFTNIFSKIKNKITPNIVMIFTMIFVMYMLFIISNYS